MAQTAVIFSSEFIHFAARLGTQSLLNLTASEMQEKKCRCGEKNKPSRTHTERLPLQA